MSESSSRLNLITIITKLQHTINQAIAEFSGKEERTLGDAVLCYFSNAEAALRASAQIQAQILADYSSNPDGSIILVKIAISSGDISTPSAKEKLISKLIKLEKLVEAGKTWITASTYLLVAEHTLVTPVGFLSDPDAIEDDKIYEVFNRTLDSEETVTYPAPRNIRFLAGVIDIWATIFLVILLAILPRSVVLNAWFFDVKRFPLTSLTRYYPESNLSEKPSTSSHRINKPSEALLWKVPRGLKAEEYYFRIAYSTNSSLASNLELKLPQGTTKLNPGFYDGLPRIKTLLQTRLKECDQVLPSNQPEVNRDIRLHYIELVPTHSLYVPPNLERISPLSDLYHVINFDPVNPIILILRLAMTNLLMVGISLAIFSSSPGGLLLGMKVRHKNSLSSVSPWTAILRALLFLSAPLWRPSCLSKNFRWSDRITNTELITTKRRGIPR